MFDKMKNLFSQNNEPGTNKGGTLPIKEIVEHIMGMDLPEDKGMCALVANPDGSEPHLVVRDSGANLIVFPLEEQELYGLRDALNKVIEIKKQK